MSVFAPSVVVSPNLSCLATRTGVSPAVSTMVEQVRSSVSRISRSSPVKWCDAPESTRKTSAPLMPGLALRAVPLAMTDRPGCDEGFPRNRDVRSHSHFAAGPGSKVWYQPSYSLNTCKYSRVVVLGPAWCFLRFFISVDDPTSTGRGTLTRRSNCGGVKRHQFESEVYRRRMR